MHIQASSASVSAFSFSSYLPTISKTHGIELNTAPMRFDMVLITFFYYERKINLGKYIYICAISKICLNLSHVFRYSNEA